MDQLRDPIEPESVSCDQLRDRHSEYLDGQLLPHEAAAFQAHIDECAACARYDRVLRHGLGLVRDLSELRPSDDFQQRLQHRLFHLQDDAMLRRREPFNGFTSAAAVAAILVVFAWSAVLLRERVIATTEVASVDVAEATLIVPLPTLDPLGAELASWYSANTAELLTHSTAVRPTIFPGLYSPLIVRPPVHGAAVRTVSAEYRVTE